PYVKDLLKMVKNKEYEVSRGNYEDRGEGTLADGYTSNDQVADVVKAFLSRTQRHGEQLRGALAFLLSHYMLLRGESIRKLEMTDLQTINLENEAARQGMDCPALVMIMRQGKTNRHNRLELAGCMRNIRVEICP
ncbi:uncharacterized protein BX664DRAFT_246057, partial [Halteromyces radiatus]|uniref:uncharacterized protein n=1 Tax=Halteromyces radiatus TaxID=101107 RepID=UPI00221F37B7